MAVSRQLVVVAVSLLIIQASFVLSSPTSDVKVKRHAQQSQTGTFLEGVGDLVTGLINTGLRSVAALISSGSEATQKMAVAVGTAALPSLLNVSRSFTRVQQSSTQLFNNSQALIPDASTLVNVTRQIVQSIRPAIGLVGQSVNNTFSRGGLLGSLGGRSNVTRVNPNDKDIPDEFEGFENID